MSDDYQYVSSAEFNVVLARIAERRAAKIAARGRSEEIASLQAAKQARGVTPEDVQAINRKINLLALTDARVRGEFKLLDAHPGFKPADPAVYAQIVSLKQQQFVMSHIAAITGVKEKLVELQLQYAVVAGELSLDELHARREVKRTPADVREAVLLKEAGASYRSIVKTFAERGVTMSIEIIAHPEQYL